MSRDNVERHTVVPREGGSRTVKEPKQTPVKPAQKPAVTEKDDADNA